MLKWLCYDESAIFYVEAVSREEAQAYALLYDGYVVCPVNDMEKCKISSVQTDGQ